MLNGIVADGGGNMRLPATMTVPGSASPPTVAALAQRWREELFELTIAFDQRNGTSHWTDTLTAALTAEPLLETRLTLDTGSRPE